MEFVRDGTILLLVERLAYYSCRQRCNFELTRSGSTVAIAAELLQPG
jgi:hypothetical protein